MSGFIGDKILNQYEAKENKRPVMPLGMKGFEQRYKKSAKMADKEMLKTKSNQKKLLKLRKKKILKFNKAQFKLTKGASRRTTPIRGFQDFNLFGGLR